jgi:DNA-binding transcriptional ArsR family regulator
MAISRAKLILHPVRLRVLTALARRQLTARQLGELLPDVPQATLYSHLGLLTKAGLLRVVSERKVRGAVEKVYAISDENASLSQVDLANASPDDHLHYFTIFVATLIGEFARYLQQDGPLDFMADGVGYRQMPFYLSDEEILTAATEVNRALFPFLANQPAPNRRRRLYTTIVFPDADPPESDEASQK